MAERHYSTDLSGVAPLSPDTIMYHKILHFDPSSLLADSTFTFISHRRGHKIRMIRYD